MTSLPHSTTRWRLLRTQANRREPNVSLKAGNTQKIVEMFDMDTAWDSSSDDDDEAEEELGLKRNHADDGWGDAGGIVEPGGDPKTYIEVWGWRCMCGGVGLLLIALVKGTSNKNTNNNNDNDNIIEYLYF